MTFIEKLTEASRRNRTLLCVGLDPDREKVPERYQREPDPILAWNRALIDATADLVCAYKPNIAFYEALGAGGWKTLQATIASVPEGIPVILDAKRGDIGNTASAYAQAIFEHLAADAVTVTPYLGRDAIRPFVNYADRGVFILCHTSNPGASDLQHLTVDNSPLYLQVARLADRMNEHGNVGLVVGATYPESLRAVREIAPDAWLLVPGIGPQGGDLEGSLAAGLRADGLGVIITSSRGVCQADDPRLAAQNLRDEINRVRDSIGKSGDAPEQSGIPAHLRPLILQMADLGCIRFGDFVLASGQHSPVYLDLRPLISSPTVLQCAARAYVYLLEDMQFDRIAAIPYAAIPIGTAVSLMTGKPLIYPRKEAKTYGTGRAIEGHFKVGERVIVLDDVISTGGSKIAALTPLQEAGLVVEDVVVLVDRGQGGALELAANGLSLQAALRMSDMIDVLLEEDRITPQQHDEVTAFLDAARREAG